MKTTTLSLLLSAFLLAGCSGGSHAPEAKAEPVVSCTSAGVCTTYPPGTTAAQIDQQNNHAPPAPPVSASTPNGVAYTIAWRPGWYYIGETGKCLMRSDTYFGVCFATQHMDYFFEVQPRRRTGTVYEDLDVGYWREEVRTWQVVNGALTGVYTVDRVLTSNGMASDWRSDRPEIAWTAAGGTGVGLSGNQAGLGGTTPGVYRRARRAVSQHVDLAAPWLVSGVETGLTIGQDGSVYAQDATGCIVSGSTADPLTGVWRAELHGTCFTGALSVYGGTVGGVTYIAGREVGGFGKLVIAATL